MTDSSSLIREIAVLFTIIKLRKCISLTLERLIQFLQWRLTNREHRVPITPRVMGRGGAAMRGQGIPTGYAYRVKRATTMERCYMGVVCQIIDLDNSSSVARQMSGDSSSPEAASSAKTADPFVRVADISPNRGISPCPLCGHSPNGGTFYQKEPS